MLLWAQSAWALTLDETVARAAEVDPTALVARLQAERGRLDATEAVFAQGVTASANASRTWSRGTVADTSSLAASVPVLDVAGWLNAAQQRAQASQLGHLADATTLDAQYAAAALFYDVLAADASHASAEEGVRYAEATLRSTEARVAAGIESELVGRSARIGLLDAQATLSATTARVEVTRARLARALEQPIAGEIVPPADVRPLPEAVLATSPWQLAYAAGTDAARRGIGERWGGLLPTASLTVSTNLLDEAGAPPLSAWALTLGAGWTFDGLAGPFLRLRQARIDLTVAEIQEQALARDLSLALESARADARAADAVAQAALARAELADESLRIGQTRLEVGLASTLEVLRLQDDAAKARRDHVQADLDRALTRLEANRVAGVGW